MVARIAANQHGVISFAQIVQAGLSPRRRPITPLAASRRRPPDIARPLAAAVFAAALERPQPRSAAHLGACPLQARRSPTSRSPAPPAGPSARASSFTAPPPSPRQTSPGSATSPSPGPHAPAETSAGTPPRPARGIERRFLRLLLDHGIPKPETNVPIGPYTVDYLWRDLALVVELDSYAYHSDRPTFTSDRKRDRYLAMRGLEVHRFSDDELDESPVDLVHSLQALLEARRRAIAG